MNRQEQLAETHILKIVLKGKTFNPDVGIKTFPEQTYGTSAQSPTHFKSPHGLTGVNGYLYEQQQQRQNKQLFLPPFSQAKYCTIVGNTTDALDSFKDYYQQQLNSTPQRFHRRKGRLSQFMDKNGWMNTVYKMMGFQRSSEARQACNRDRQKNIKSARKPNFYINPVEKKTSLPKQNCIKSTLLTQRTKVRTERISLQQQKKDALNIQKLMTITCKKSPQKDPYIDAEQLTNIMSRTANQKEWKSTMASIRKKFTKNQVPERMSLTRSDWSTNNQSIELKPGLGNSMQIDELREWFNTTCNSRANPWKYRKPQKVATASDEQPVD